MRPTLFALALVAGTVHGFTALTTTPSIRPYSHIPHPTLSISGFDPHMATTNLLALFPWEVSYDPGYGSGTSSFDGHEVSASD